MQDHSRSASGGERLHEHVVPLGRGDRTHAEQASARRAARHHGRGVDPGRHDVHAVRCQAVGASSQSRGPPARRDHRRRRVQHRALPRSLVGPRRSRAAGARRLVHDPAGGARGPRAAGAAASGTSDLGHGRGDEAVEQHDGRRRGCRSARPPGRPVTTSSGPRPVARDRCSPDRPPVVAEPVAHPPVVGVAAARPRRVVDPVGHDDVHGAHGARSKDAHATCGLVERDADGGEAARRPGRARRRARASASRSATTCASRSVVVFTPGEGGVVVEVAVAELADDGGEGVGGPADVDDEAVGIERRCPEAWRRRRRSRRAAAAPGRTPPRAGCGRPSCGRGRSR